jgi:hypothetical protein
MIVLINFFETVNNLIWNHINFLVIHHRTILITVCFLFYPIYKTGCQYNCQDFAEEVTTEYRKLFFQEMKKDGINPLFNIVNNKVINR